MTRQDDINPLTAQALTDAGDVRLIDVRDATEWAAGHAADAEHHPLDTLDPQQIPTDRPIVTICRSGRRSGLAADQLAATHTVTNVAGGLGAWVDAGLPLHTDDGRPGTLG